MKFTIAIPSITIGFILSLLLSMGAQAAPAPKNAIAYSQQHMIWVTFAQGGQSRPFTSVNATDLQWSPDGKWLAFINTTSNTLEMIDHNGHNRQLLTIRGFCDATSPVWSPNNTSIAFVCSRTVHGEKQHALLRLAVATKKVDAIRSWTAHEAYRSPSWSPDGSNIAYETLDSASAQLVVTDLDHARTRSLVALSDITALRHIAWSPTGKKILYNDSENELYTIWADGSHRSTISDGDSYDGSWSPDGTNIVFIEDPADGRLSISRSDGSIAYIPLAVPAGTLSAPEWSSDAQQIAFRVNGVKGGLFSIDLRTHAVTKVASGSVDNFSWQPQKR